jgi:hypothetical protein
MITPEMIKEALNRVRTLWNTRRDNFTNWHGYAASGKGDAAQIKYYILPDTSGSELLNHSSDISELVPVVIEEMPQFVQAAAGNESLVIKLRPGTGVRSVSSSPDCTKRCPGTIGAFLRKKGTTSPVWLLSNFHVLVKDEDCLPVKVFSQQGDFISDNVKFIPLFDTGNEVDVAVAEIDPAFPDPLYDPLKISDITPMLPADGDLVQKLGAKTGLTCGKVRHQSCTMDVLDCDENNNLEFINQIMVDSIPGKRPFLGKGDSGSLMVSKTRPAGLLFAISNPLSADPFTGLVNPWQVVLNKLATIIPPPIEMLLSPNIKTEDPCI